MDQLKERGQSVDNALFVVRYAMDAFSADFQYVPLWGSCFWRIDGANLKDEW